MDMQISKIEWNKDGKLELKNNADIVKDQTKVVEKLDEISKSFPLISKTIYNFNITGTFDLASNVTATSCSLGVSIKDVGFEFGFLDVVLLFKNELEWTETVTFLNNDKMGDFIVTGIFTDSYGNENEIPIYRGTFPDFTYYDSEEGTAFPMTKLTIPLINFNDEKLVSIDVIASTSLKRVASGAISISKDQIFDYGRITLYRFNNNAINLSGSS